MKIKSEKKLMGLGVLTAISASLCCITPVLALLAGTSGFASTFSVLEPIRPYFIGLTILVLGFAWYQKLKPNKQADCNCDPQEKIPVMQTKKFLSAVTVFAGLMLALPMYSGVFYSETEKQTISDPSKIRAAAFKISGMTCSGCEEHVNREVSKLKGIIKTTVTYENGKALIEFDRTETNVEEIERAIAETGYSVTDKREAK